MNLLALVPIFSAAYVAGWSLWHVLTTPNRPTETDTR